MPALVAFASLPFGLRGEVYSVQTSKGLVDVHVSELSFTPFISISSRPELAQSLPEGGAGEGFTSYTWYDHPFVLRVVFGRNVAALGSINSCATIVRPLSAELNLASDAALERIRAPFAELALEAFNNLIAIVRYKAHLYHISDLRRDDIDITVRSEQGELLRDDPLQDDLLEQEQAQTETFDLLEQDQAWYQELAQALAKEQPLGLADDLLVEAERALTQRFPRQAIATCHTAIEAAASALLTQGMQKRGLADREIDHQLSTRSLTSKLEVLLRRYTGFSLKRDNHALWRAFSELNDLRNDTVHRGEPPVDADAEFAIHVTRDLLAWLDLVRQRNRIPDRLS
ncbi:MAG: hypothetical protein JXA74_18245 [Anaerolineae bacterium]|nr:hypothetical protein [Anaerolineae bacterium]